MVRIYYIKNIENIKVVLFHCNIVNEKYEGDS